jgi:hypothetical protein
VAAFFELGAQLDVVEYLAVEDRPDRAVLVRDGLIASGQVDDGEARMRETYGPILEETEAVRPPVPDGMDHAFELGARGSCLFVRRENACYATQIAYSENERRT